MGHRAVAPGVLTKGDHVFYVKENHKDNIIITQLKVSNPSNGNNPCQLLPLYLVNVTTTTTTIPPFLSCSGVSSAE